MKAKIEKQVSNARNYFGGCGEQSIRAALEAIAKAAGARGKLIYVSC